jgi:endo-1,4-beta-mannosidase
MLNGQPFRFNGLNIYSAYNRSCLSCDLSAVGSGQEVFRAFFYQNMATVNGQRDWTALDRVISTAAAHGMKVIPVLTDQWGASTDGPEKRLPWWPAPYGGDGYKTTKWNTTDLVPYRQWVQEVVSHYKNSTTVAFWQLINEGEARAVDGSNNETVAREAIRTFADDVGGLVKSIDPNHLVSLGTIAGEAGSNDADYTYIHSSPYIDIADYHDYGSPYSPMGNTDPNNGLQADITRIHAIGKAIMVGESGIHWTSLDTPTLARRAQLFDQKMAAEFQAGVVGSMMWCWNDPAAASRDYEIGPGDPSLALLAKY